jgi:hypothetical protein
MNPPKETEAPALPNIVLGIIKDNASSEVFLTLPGIRDRVIDKMRNWIPDTSERRRLYVRIRYCMPTVQLIDKKVKIKEALTQRKTKIIKVYYYV